MRGFFHFLRNLILLALLAFGVWSYQNNPNVRTATNDSIATLGQRVTQLFATGTLNPPKLGDVDPNLQSEKSKNNHDEPVKSKAGAKTWSKASANVYLDIKDNAQLHSATIDAMNAWNRTGTFLFKQIDNKKKANIIVSVMDDSGTSAAGQTSTTYNPVTGHLLKAKVQLNRYYLQNSWYGYSNDRIVNTAEHELGHAIGLNHNKGVSVMYPSGSIYTIQPQDIKAVKKLYHEN